ncbi:MAG: hypothetical protein WCO86_18190 [Planctomycetota bacterium]
MSDMAKHSLADLTWGEFVLLSALIPRQPEILRRHLQDREESNIDRPIPSWLHSWVDRIHFSILFSVSEGDSIEGVAYVLWDEISKAYWFGVTGGLEEVFEYSPPSKPETRLADLPPSYGQRIWRIPTNKQSIDADDVYATWSCLLCYNHDNLVSDLLGNCKVYNTNLVPPEHLKRFVTENAKTYVKGGKLGFDEWGDGSGPFVSVDDFVGRAYTNL